MAIPIYLILPDLLFFSCLLLWFTLLTPVFRRNVYHT